MSIKDLRKLSKEIVLLTLEISYQGQVGHLGSALSISDLLTALYFSHLKSHDRFILSKGHAAAALYSVLYKKGILKKKELSSFGQDGGFCEHPLIQTSGVEMTAGSLGHGLAFGLGLALGIKKKDLSSQVFVLISDGECNEGSIWEAALLAAQLNLVNLTVILDYNGWQCFGSVNQVINLEPLDKKWQAFGWQTLNIDGHNLTRIKSALKSLPLKRGQPSIIIAKTIMGRGISLIENNQLGHHKVLDKNEYLQAKKELNKV